MKKTLIFLLTLILISAPMFTFSLTAQDLSDQEMKENLKSVGVSIWEIGLMGFLKGGIINICMLLLALGFIAQIIIRITPNKKDDAFFNKYIVKGLRLIFHIMSYGSAYKKEIPVKKK